MAYDNRSLEELENLHKSNGTSIGFIKPRQVLDFIIEPVSVEWDPKKLEALKRANLPGLFPVREHTGKLLEKVPYKCSFKFLCYNPGCKGHTLQVLDWEVGQSIRSWRHQYESDKVVLEKMRQKYLVELAWNKDVLKICS